MPLGQPVRSSGQPQSWSGYTVMRINLMCMFGLSRYRSNAYGLNMAHSKALYSISYFTLTAKIMQK